MPTTMFPTINICQLVVVVCVCLYVSSCHTITPSKSMYYYHHTGDEKLQPA